MTAPVARPSWLLSALTLGLAALFLSLLPPAAAQQAPSAAFREGTHVFRRILRDMQLRPLLDLDAIGNFAEQTPPNKAIVIFLGDPEPPGEGNGKLPPLPEKWLTNFLKEGGAALFASDRCRRGWLRDDLVRLSGVRITGEQLCCNVKDSYYRNSNCPLLLPVHDQRGPNLFRNATRVATNLPSWLAESSMQNGEPLPKLAILPEGCFRSPSSFVSQRGFPRMPPTPPLFAVGGAVGGGRLLVLADQSIFINAMMLPPENHNVEFAWSCIDYLRDTGEKRRDAVLFVEEGTVNSFFNIPLKEPPRISIKVTPEQVDATDKWLAEQEDRLAEEQTVEHFLRERGISLDRSSVLRGTLLLLSLALVAFGCWRLLQTRGVRPDTAVPLSPQTSSPAVTSGPLLELRQEALLSQGNLWENARFLARQVFDEAGISAVERKKTSAASSRLPWIGVAGSWWQRWWRRRQVVRLWRLAFDPTPIRISTAGWQHLMYELEQLRTDLVRGVVQVRQPS